MLKARREIPISPALVAVSRIVAARIATRAGSISRTQLSTQVRTITSSALEVIPAAIFSGDIAAETLAAIPATGSLAQPFTGSPRTWGVMAERATIEMPANRTRTA